MDMGKQIRQLRIQKDARQETLAEYLNVSAQAVSKWENGASLPDITLLPKIAVFFGVTIDALFRISDEDRMLRIENVLCVQRTIDDETFSDYIHTLERLVDEGAHALRALLCMAELHNHRAQSGHRAADAGNT